jgi:Fe2+ transport system protein FeoA
MSKKKNSSNSNNPNSDNVNANRLHDWISQGLVVDQLIQSIRSGNTVATDELFRSFEGKANRLEKVKDRLEELGFDEGHELFPKVSSMLNNPLQVEILESLATSLETGPKVKELKAELGSLNTKGFEEEANRIRVMLDDGTDLTVIENDIKKLQKRIKEKFFEMAFEEAAVPQAEAAKFTAEIIFLLHRDGTLLSVKSRKPPTELDKKLMSRMVMAIKEQMGRAFREGEHVHTLTYDGHTIILEDSVHVYAAVVIVGEPKPVMYRVILKALQIMEKKLANEFDTWKGERGSLENLDKYISAIFQALEKLN